MNKYTFILQFSFPLMNELNIHFIGTCYTHLLDLARVYNKDYIIDGHTGLCNVRWQDLYRVKRIKVNIYRYTHFSFHKNSLKCSLNMKMWKDLMKNTHEWKSNDFNIQVVSFDMLAVTVFKASNQQTNMKMYYVLTSKWQSLFSKFP